jgi:hypothetical protein
MFLMLFKKNRFVGMGQSQNTWLACEKKARTEGGSGRRKASLLWQLRAEQQFDVLQCESEFAHVFGVGRRAVQQTHMKQLKGKRNKKTDRENEGKRA